MSTECSSVSIPYTPREGELVPRSGMRMRSSRSTAQCYQCQVNDGTTSEDALVSSGFCLSFPQAPGPYPKNRDGAHLNDELSPRIDFSNITLIVTEFEFHRSSIARKEGSKRVGSDSYGSTSLNEAVPRRPLTPAQNARRPHPNPNSNFPNTATEDPRRGSSREPRALMICMYLALGYD